jgi:hypothetical protein
LWEDGTGHIRLGTLQRSKKWLDVIDLLETGSHVENTSEAAARASERDLKCALDDLFFQFVTKLPVKLLLLARDFFARLSC